MKIGSKLKPVRFSYAHLVVPQTMEDGDNLVKKYKVMVLIPKTNIEDITKIKSELAKVRDSNKDSKFDGVINGIRLPLRDGDTDLTYSGRPEFAGHFFMNCGNTRKPELFDGDLKEITNPNEIKSGDYGMVSVDFFAYSKKGNKGISVSLSGVRKTRDGEPLGGSSSSAISDLEDEDELDPLLL